jgi:hypothetical protein
MILTQLPQPHALMACGMTSHSALTVTQNSDQQSCSRNKALMRPTTQISISLFLTVGCLFQTGCSRGSITPVEITVEAAQDGACDYLITEIGIDSKHTNVYRLFNPGPLPVRFTVDAISCGCAGLRSLTHDSPLAIGDQFVIETEGSDSIQLSVQLNRVTGRQSQVARFSWTTDDGRSGTFELKATATIHAAAHCSPPVLSAEMQDGAVHQKTLEVKFTRRGECSGQPPEFHTTLECVTLEDTERLSEAALSGGLRTESWRLKCKVSLPVGGNVTTGSLLIQEGKEAAVSIPVSLRRSVGIAHYPNDLTITLSQLNPDFVQSFILSANDERAFTINEVTCDCSDITVSLVKPPIGPATRHVVAIRITSGKNKGGGQCTIRFKTDHQTQPVICIPTTVAN